MLRLGAAALEVLRCLGTLSVLHLGWAALNNSWSASIRRKKKRNRWPTVIPYVAQGNTQGVAGSFVRAGAPWMEYGPMLVTRMSGGGGGGGGGLTGAGSMCHGRPWG